MGEREDVSHPSPAPRVLRRISLLPRWIHRLYANRLGYFWKDCARCYRPFGGHEWREINGYPCTVQIENHCRSDRPCSVAICPDCTRAGQGGADK